MRETGVSKWRGERRGNADQEQREEDAARRKDRGYLLSLRRGKEEVNKASDGSERGLDRVQDQRKGKSLRRRLWFSGGCGADGIARGSDGLLQNTPREAFDM